MVNIDPGNSYSYGSLGAAMLGRIGSDLPSQARPLEYFGGQATAFNGTPVDNRAAFEAAIDWCESEGGMLVLGAGEYGISGSVTLKSFTTIIGAGWGNTIVKQIGSSSNDVFTSNDGAGQNIYNCYFADFTIDGGWTVNWNNNLSGHSAAGIRLLGGGLGVSGGPDDPAALDREDVNNLSDPYHIVTRVRFRNIAGSGLVLSGRGEMQIVGNRFNRCSVHGINCAAPDNWFMSNTISTTGDTGFYLEAGNNRLVNEKYWFCGMRRDDEGVGAGLEIVGSGVGNIVAANVTTQDTWGPGLVAEGDHLMFTGSFDEAGGGRLEQQGFGYSGSRSEQRSFLRVANLQHSEIKASIDGGNRNGSGNRPSLVDMDGSGADHNQINLFSAGASYDSATPVRTANGYTNNNRFSVVRYNNRTVLGVLSEADLLTASHSVNSEHAPDQVQLDDGRLAVKNSTGWTIFSGTDVVPV